ncbi:MAG: hypothetical protein RIT02_1287 [Planctomycetota bacterium]|jgi:hypothetical protein
MLCPPGFVCPPGLPESHRLVEPALCADSVSPKSSCVSPESPRLCVVCVPASSASPDVIAELAKQLCRAVPVVAD